MDLRSSPAPGTLAVLYLVLGLSCAAGSGSAGATAPVPRHLAIARELVERVQPEENHYRLGGELVTFPGDAPGSRYAVTADCSGFLLAIFARAGYPVRAQMSYLVKTPKRRRPRAEDFVLSIEEGKGFIRIDRVTGIKPGDLLAHAMLDLADQQQTQTSGHVFLIDSEPRKIWAWPPVVPGTTQYEVLVIDSNGEHVGDDDTRRLSGKSAGLGRGTIRLYANDEGELVGWARTFSGAKRFFSYDPRYPSDTKRRKAAIGRPLP